MEEIEKEVVRALEAQEISDLNSMIATRGWIVYKKLLEQLFEDHYVKLRKGWQDIEDYSHLCGILDGLEKAIIIVENEIEEYNENHKEGSDGQQPN